MLLSLDFTSDIPIYQQLRNQIVLGIASGTLTPGEKLPTIRALAQELGINMMTVSKAYQILKQEGYIASDRRNGAWVAPRSDGSAALERLEGSLRLIVAEARVAGVTADTVIALIQKLYLEGA
ncbi:MAG: GntR family transcriptional regulator [Oscillospiraceae bacterium]|nr:GntR family transcriptional regulator [Oscillospiraceae bacterium]